MSLNVRNAIGPNLLPTRVLKEAAHEIAPILQVIIQASINRSEVPKDRSCLQKRIQILPS